MNKERANKLLEVYGTPKVQVGKTTLVFARCNNTTIEEIEKMPDKELVSQWKGKE
tara:strand:+ start:472 stop:636 length:165 start_codon:yes stop_codon:yes gene_type:complete